MMNKIKLNIEGYMKKIMILIVLLINGSTASASERRISRTRLHAEPKSSSHYNAIVAQKQKEKHDGLMCCLAATVPAVATAGLWAWIAYNDTSNGVCTPPAQAICYQNVRVGALDCCCKACASTSFIMCMLGGCQLCGCDECGC